MVFLCVLGVLAREVVLSDFFFIPKFQISLASVYSFNAHRFTSDSCRWPEPFWSSNELTKDILQTEIWEGRLDVKAEGTKK